MLRSKAADCTVIGKGEAEWSLRDNIVGDSAAAASASVLGIRKRSNSSSYVRMYTTTSGLGSEGIERFFVTAIPPKQYIRMYVMMNSHTKSGIYIRIFSLIRNGMSELRRRLPACRSVGLRDHFKNRQSLI